MQGAIYMNYLKTDLGDIVESLIFHSELQYIGFFKLRYCMK